MSDYPAPDDSMFQEPQADSMEEESYPKHPCRLCDGFVQAGEDESKWGVDWYKGYVHFSCIENIFDATRRMRNKPELAQLESQIDAMRDFMALLYLGIREGRDEAFEALDEKTKRLIDEVWFERLEDEDEIE